MPHKDREERRAYNAAYNAAYRAAHREERRAYAAAHREELRAYYAAYDAAHRKERRAYDAAINPAVGLAGDRMRVRSLPAPLQPVALAIREARLLAGERQRKEKTS